MKKLERKCLECPVVMFITDKQAEHKEFCSVTCWWRFNTEFLWKPCTLCKTEFLHKSGTSNYCSKLCFKMALYQVFLPNSIEDNIKPQRKNWVNYCMATNPDYKSAEQVPQFVW